MNINKIFFTYMFFYLLNTCFTANSMHQAVITGNLVELNNYLQNTQNINQQDANGDTVLHLAVKNNNVEIINLLLNTGINLGITNNEKKKAIDYAQNDDIINLINSAQENIEEQRENEILNILLPIALVFLGSNIES